MVEAASVARPECAGVGLLVWWIQMTFELKVYLLDRQMFHLHHPEGELGGYNLLAREHFLPGLRTAVLAMMERRIAALGSMSTARMGSPCL